LRILVILIDVWRRVYIRWNGVARGVMRFRAPFKTWHGESDGVRF
jgi:hypothetical protein